MAFLDKLRTDSRATFDLSSGIGPGRADGTTLVLEGPGSHRWPGN
jgi:hypothetical protein